LKTIHTCNIILFVEKLACAAINFTDQSQVKLLSK
jgi:hypothetical protein